MATPAAVAPQVGSTNGGDPAGQTLQTFSLDDLAQYTVEKSFGPTASADFRVFYVGRDDVHRVLMHLFTRVTLSVKMNMFGYDDDELNNELMRLAQDSRIMVQVTLDRTQSAGAHEAALLNEDWAQERIQFATDFVIGSSPWHQISHTKGGVPDGIVAFEGSTNWSDSGEGKGIQLTQATQNPDFPREIKGPVRGTPSNGVAGGGT
jgi:hypothetical protein